MRPYDQVREAFRGTPLDGAAERTKAVLDLADDNPAWVIAAIVTLANAGLEAKLDATRLAIADIERTLPESMRAAGAEITRALAADIASQSVTAFAEGGAETIRVGILPALLTVSADHRASMEAVATKLEQRAVNFANGADQAKRDLVVAATDVRNHAAAITRLHLSHILARAAWMLGGMVLAAAITFDALHWYDHASCVHTAQRFSTHAQRAMLEGVFCK